MQPCPCGFHGDLRRQCICTPERVAAYRARISGPLAERIDLHVEVPRQTEELLAAAAPSGEDSTSVRERVAEVRSRQIMLRGALNGDLSGATITGTCLLTRSARELLGHALDRLGLSARGYHKVLRLALTIADMAGADGVRDEHVAEAIGFRVLDRRMPLR